jgi:hypothetical protein
MASMMFVKIHRYATVYIVVICTRTSDIEVFYPERQVPVLCIDVSCDKAAGRNGKGHTWIIGSVDWSVSFNT